jgi:hypothetical protein
MISLSSNLHYHGVMGTGCIFGHPQAIPHLKTRSSRHTSSNVLYRTNFCFHCFQKEAHRCFPVTITTASALRAASFTFCFGVLRNVPLLLGLCRSYQLPVAIRRAYTILQLRAPNGFIATPPSTCFYTPRKPDRPTIVRKQSLHR